MSAGLIEDGSPTHRTKAPEKANKTHIGNRTVEWRPALGRRRTSVHKKRPIPMFARSITYLVVTFLALVVTAPVSARGLPGWAEPSGGSEPRESRFHEREVQRERTERELSCSRQRPLGPGYQTDPLGPVTNNREDPGACIGAPDFWQCIACNWGDNCDSYCQSYPNADVCENYTPLKVPVDDYLPLLMLAGIAYAALRLRQ